MSTPAGMSAMSSASNGWSLTGISRPLPTGFQISAPSFAFPCFAEWRDSFSFFPSDASSFFAWCLEWWE